MKAAFDPKGILNPGVKIPGRGPLALTAAMLKVGAGAPAIPAAVAKALRMIEREAQWSLDRLGLTL